MLPKLDNIKRKSEKEYANMKKLIILLILLAACTQDEQKDFQLAVLAPVTYEFSTGADQNRIDYFYVPGNFPIKKEPMKC
jgi:hypothetical protein